MKRLLLGLALMLLLAEGGLAQISPPTMSVKKFVGDTTTFTWDYLIADEATMTHFSVKWVDSLTGTFIELKTVPKTARTTTTSASFTPGFKFTYYAVTAVDARVTTAVLESLPSNTVATERVGKPPTNNTVQ
jgi:hypothetical protein